MQTIVSQLDSAFRAAIQKAFGLDADPLISVAQNEKFGDYQSNAAMGLAKQLAEKTGAKANPRQVAEGVKANLDLGVMADEVSIAGPGFINVRLSPQWITKQLAAVGEGGKLGVEPKQPTQTVVIDYGGPNVAKQMHVGHLRSTIIGDCLARVLEFLGHRVVRQNHLGDWGTQFGMLIAYLKLQSVAGAGGAELHIEDLDRFYKQARAKFDAEPAFAEEARATVVRFQAGADEEIGRWRQIVDESRRHFQPVFDRLGIKLTRADERGESFYNPMLSGVVSDLTNAGKAVESEGAKVVFTAGEEAPLIIQKRDGGFGYATTDLAAIRFRVGKLHADRVVYVVGSPQGQHFRQVFTAAREAGWAGDAKLEHAAFGSVLGEDGKMFKARSGDSVKLVDLLNEAEERAFKVVTEVNPELPEMQRRDIARAVGVGSIKYADLSKDRIGDYTFSWDQMLALKGNSAPYLQYAHARVRAIFRKAEQQGVTYGGLGNTPITLDVTHELALAKQILRFGEVVDLVGRELKPHHLCAYLYELASRFSGFYDNCPVLTSDDPIRSSRLALADLTAQTIACGLDLLGIEHPDQM